VKFKNSVSEKDKYLKVEIYDRILMEIGDKTFYVKIKDGESKIEEISDLSEIDEI